MPTIDEYTVLVAGSMTIDDFNEALGTHLPQDGARTSAGLLFNALGRRPKPGDAITIGATPAGHRPDGRRADHARARRAHARELAELITKRVRPAVYVVACG